MFLFPLSFPQRTCSHVCTRTRPETSPNVLNWVCAGVCVSKKYMAASYPLDFMGVLFLIFLSFYLGMWPHVYARVLGPYGAIWVCAKVCANKKKYEPDIVIFSFMFFRSCFARLHDAL